MSGRKEELVAKDSPTAANVSLSTGSYQMAGVRLNAVMVIGCSYKTSPIAIREEIAGFLSNRANRAALHSLSGVTESALLVTCNRIEAILVSKAPSSTRDAFFHLMERSVPERIEQFFYCLEGSEALVHLFSVSSGLDSMVFGEEQILNQVRESGIDERANGFSKSVLSTVFDAAYRVGSFVRANYQLGTEYNSVGQFSTKVISGLIRTAPRTLLIGTGKTIRLAANELDHSELYVATKRKRLPQGLKAKRIPYRDIRKFSRQCDLIICGTDHEGFLIGKEDLSQEKPTVVLDLAFPRNADPAIGSKLVTVYNLDDLARYANRLPRANPKLKKEIDSMIAKEAADLQRWLTATKLSSTLSELFLWGETIRLAETERALRKLPGLSAHDRDVIEVMGRRLTSKILSRPTNFAKSSAGEMGQSERLALIQRIFSLEAPKDEAKND